VHDYLLSVILGIIEGLTEFLPVSSTAHLRITEALLHIDLHDGFWKMYSVVIQLGAILSVVVYFRDRIAKFIRTFPKGERGDRNLLTHPLSLTMIAFVVTAGPAFLLKKKIGDNLENIHVIAIALFAGGLVMWVVDALCRRPRVTHMEEMSLPQAVWIGAVQILSAVFPGTSRSMATIAAGQVSGMSRESALEFSFFLSIPTMIVATGFELLHSIIPHRHHGVAIEPASTPVVMHTHQWIVLAIGFIISFVVALGVVAWFMHWVRKHGFIPFAIYRILLGAALFFWM
jgi:undecaprenyl-diphosphatase